MFPSTYLYLNNNQILEDEDYSIIILQTFQFEKRFVC
jgi:hypothetical protein